MKLKTLETIIVFANDYADILNKSLNAYDRFRKSEDREERLSLATLAFDYCCKAIATYECGCKMGILVLIKYLNKITNDTYEAHGVACGEEYDVLASFLSGQ